MPADKYDEMARELFREWNALPAQQRIVPAVLASRIAALVRAEVEAECERLLAPVLDFVKAQGCGCCGADYETRSKVDRALGVAFGVPLFDDESGTNWDAAAIRARGGAKKEESDAE